MYPQTKNSLTDTSPDYAVMPGVLIVEALAQVGAVAVLKKEENRGRLAFFCRYRQLPFQKTSTPR